jgi:hypothetical protein
MNRKKVLTDLLFYLALWFIGPILVDFAREHWHINSMTIILDAMGAIAISFGIVGLHELDRGGHRRVKRILSKCVFGWLAACFVLVCIMLIFKDHALEPVLEYLIYPFLALIAASFPLALYLNRDQNKSKAQIMIDNVN